MYHLLRGITRWYYVCRVSIVGGRFLSFAPCNPIPIKQLDTADAHFRLYANGGQEAFNRFKEDNGVKTCPRCGMAITKDEGCNHVECSCKVHICWQCMKVFDGPDGMRDCYRHMAEEHGSYGEEEVEADED